MYAKRPSIRRDVVSACSRRIIKLALLLGIILRSMLQDTAPRYWLRAYTSHVLDTEYIGLKSIPGTCYPANPNSSFILQYIHSLGLRRRRKQSPNGVLCRLHRTHTLAVRPWAAGGVTTVKRHIGNPFPTTVSTAKNTRTCH